jgi:hypothetical protein
MYPERFLIDLQDRLGNDFLGVLSATPHWFSEPTRAAINRMLSDVRKVLDDHAAAKVAAR